MELLLVARPLVPRWTVAPHSWSATSQEPESDKLLPEGSRPSLASHFRSSMQAAGLHGRPSWLLRAAGLESGIVMHNIQRNNTGSAKGNVGFAIWSTIPSWVDTPMHHLVVMYEGTGAAVRQVLQQKWKVAGLSSKTAGRAKTKGASRQGQPCFIVTFV